MCTGLARRVAQQMRVGDTVSVGSRIEDRSPYFYDHYTAEALQPSLADYVLVAHAGHGANSYAISYYLAYSGYRVVLQLACAATALHDSQAAEASTLWISIDYELTRKRRYALGAAASPPNKIQAKG